MTSRDEMQEEYRSILADIGIWAEVLNLPPDGQVVGTGRRADDGHHVIQYGPVKLRRTEHEEHGEVVEVHHALPDGTPGEWVAVLQPREGRAPKLVEEYYLLPTSPTVAPNQN